MEDVQLLPEAMMSDKVSKSAVTVRDSAGVIDLTPSHYLSAATYPCHRVASWGGIGGCQRFLSLVLPLNARYCLSISLASSFTASNRNLFLFSSARFFEIFLRLGLCLGDPRCHSCWWHRTAQRQVAKAPRVRGEHSLSTLHS